MYKSLLFGILTERSECMHTALEESGTDDAALSKAPVSKMITILIQLNYFRICATQIYFSTCE